jgi:16S rRNA (guanine1207-N2)-methyltransferase
MNTEAHWDIEYRVPPDGRATAGAKLVVDYDCLKLKAVTDAPTRCCELADLYLDAPVQAILMHVLPFTANAQIARDLAAAGRLVEAGGTVEVVIHQNKARRSVQRIAGDWYEDVTLRKGQSPRLICRTPKSGEVPEVFENVAFVDPVSGRTLQLQTRKELFSYGRIDPGTRLLLATVPDVSGKNVLDIGCGYGAVGVTLAARGAIVTMIDVDSRAVALARFNLETNALSAAVFVHDGADVVAEAAFDTVIANPPTHAGSETLQKIFSAILKELVPGGCSYLVVRAHLNYEKWLVDRARVDQVADDQGYKILRIAKRPA